MKGFIVLLLFSLVSAACISNTEFTESAGGVLLQGESVSVLGEFGCGSLSYKVGKISPGLFYVTTCSGQLVKDNEVKKLVPAALLFDYIRTVQRGTLLPDEYQELLVKMGKYFDAISTPDGPTAALSNWKTNIKSIKVNALPSANRLLDELLNATTGISLTINDQMLLMQEVRSNEVYFTGNKSCARYATLNSSYAKFIAEGKALSLKITSFSEKFSLLRDVFSDTSYKQLVRGHLTNIGVVSFGWSNGLASLESALIPQLASFEATGGVALTSLLGRLGKLELEGIAKEVVDSYTDVGQRTTNLGSKLMGYPQAYTDRFTKISKSRTSVYDALKAKNMTLQQYESVKARLQALDKELASLEEDALKYTPGKEEKEKQQASRDLVVPLLALVLLLFLAYKYRDKLLPYIRKLPGMESAFLQGKEKKELREPGDWQSEMY